MPVIKKRKNKGGTANPRIRPCSWPLFLWKEGIFMTREEYANMLLPNVLHDRKYYLGMKGNVILIGLAFWGKVVRGKVDRIFL